MSAWKDWERQVCRDFGVRRKPTLGPDGWARGSDDDGTCFFSLEIKRSKRRVPEGRWIEQARRQGKEDERPWLLVVRGHGNATESKPIVVCDYQLLLALARKAGVLDD